MATKIFDAGHLAEEQQSRITSSTAIGFNALQPILRLQVSMLRLWANNIEALAQNYEKGFDTYRSSVEDEAQRRRAA